MTVTILHGDCRTVLPTLPDASVQCCVTSPPYYNLRDYQTSGQIGLEATVQEYVAELVRVFRGVKRVLRDDGTLWLNLGSSYASGGKRPNQSPLPSRALACDTGDTEPLGSQAFGCACPDRHGERSSGCLCRHGRTPGTAQQHQPDALPHGPKAHGSALPDCAGASLVGASPSSLASTTPASAQSVPAVTSLADAASACLSSRPTSSPLSLASSRKSGGTIDTSQHRPTSESHTKGRDVSGAACGAPDCDGCGICWSYLAIPALRFKSKDLMDIPALVAFALQADGWYLRSDIIWAKSNPMPESVKGSHFTRHMVTIADYERLSGLPYIDERAGADWAGDMPGLSEIEAPRSKSPLRAKSQGAGHGASTRGTCGCEGEASALCCVGTREGQSGQVSEDGEGQGAHEEACRCVSGDSGRAGFGQEARRKSSRIDTAGGGRRDGAGLVSDIGTPQAPLLLLREANGEDDVGSCDPVKQRRAELAGEHRSGVRAVQQRQEGSDLPSGLVGCPGCDKCSEHHGYIFHLSAGRPTSAHEHVFLLTKRGAYFYDAGAIAETAESFGRQHTSGEYSPKTQALKDSGHHGKGGDLGINYEREQRNARNVWTIATQPYSGAHFATMPPELAERCIKAGTKPGDTVLDPFGGAGTTGLVADRLNRSAVLIELNPEYRTLAAGRITDDAPLFAGVA